MIGTEPSQRGIERVVNVRRCGVCALELAGLLVDHVAPFRHERDLVAMLRQVLADEPFGRAAPVCVGGVEQGDARIERGGEHMTGRLTVVLTAPPERLAARRRRSADAPRAHAERRHHRPVRPQLSLHHNSPFCSSVCSYTAVLLSSTTSASSSSLIDATTRSRCARSCTYRSVSVCSP